MKISIEHIKKMAIHYVGNKSRGEGVKFSQVETDFQNAETSILQQAKNAFNFDQFYEFFYTHNISLNPLYSFVETLFSDNERLIEVSQSIVSHLYDQSTHAKVKSGELYVLYFKDCLVEDEITDAIGIFKSENKDSFLKVNPLPDSFEIESLQGTNINKLDKGCLIFNTNKENGYLVSVVDNTNKTNEAQYWINDFLHVRPRKDGFYNTQNAMSLCKKFISEELPNKFNISKTEQADYMNKSVDFFKEEKTFEIEDFSKKVIHDPEITESFKSYKNRFEKEQGFEIADNFSISETATKKQSRIFKSVLKLDKNFHIYIHGDKELIEKGIDEGGKKFYKIYYKEES
jgi:hypothetical protein